MSTFHLEITEATGERVHQAGPRARLVLLSPRDWQRQARALAGVPAALESLWIPGCFLMLYAPSNFEEATSA